MLLPQILFFSQVNVFKFLKRLFKNTALAINSGYDVRK